MGREVMVDLLGTTAILEVTTGMPVTQAPNGRLR